MLSYICDQRFQLADWLDRFSIRTLMKGSWLTLLSLLCQQLIASQKEAVSLQACWKLEDLHWALQPVLLLSAGPRIIAGLHVAFLWFLRMQMLPSCLSSKTVELDGKSYMFSYTVWDQKFLFYLKWGWMEFWISLGHYLTAQQLQGTCLCWWLWVAFLNYAVSICAAVDHNCILLTVK